MLQGSSQEVVELRAEVEDTLAEAEWFGTSMVALKKITVEALGHVRCLLEDGPLQSAAALEFIWRADPSDHYRQLGKRKGDKLCTAAEKRKEEGTYRGVMAALQMAESIHIYIYWVT
jgi:hypothetical protein